MATWAQLVPALQVDPDISPTLARGEYLAMTTCNECHGLDLKGDPPDGSGSPDLTLIIQAYNQADFEHLMRTGEAIGGRSDLGLMSVVAKDRFAYLTQQELDDLYLYLRSLHGVPTP